MTKIEKGQVFSFKSGGPKYVYYGSVFKEWYNAGGFGEYLYKYIKLDDMLKLGDIQDTEELSNYIQESQQQQFFDSIIVHEDEAPFDISSRKTELFTIRRKVAKTIAIYE